MSAHGQLRRHGVDARPAVGAAVPWVSARGAVATQAKANTELGRRALALLEQDVSVGVALAALLDGDGAFAHSGIECVTWYGDRPAADFSVAGNMLTGPQVLDAMAAAACSAHRSRTTARDAARPATTAPSQPSK